MGKVSKIECTTLLLLAAEGYQSELGLVFSNIVHKGVKESLGVFRGHDDPVADVRFGQSRQHGSEIDDEFAVGMGDYGQV